MCNDRCIVTVTKMTLLALFCFVGSLQAVDSNQLRSIEYFNEAQRLVTTNCGDCNGSTKTGLEKGIALLKLSLEEGYNNKSDAYRLLEKALSTLQFVFVPPDSQEQRDIARERERLLSLLVAMNPLDPEIAYSQAIMESDIEAQHRALLHVIQLDFSYADAHFAIGMLLYRQNKLAEAIVEVRLALEFSDGERAEVFGSQLVRALSEAGRAAEIEAVQQIIKAKAK